MSDCIFCQIANHEIPKEIALETDQVMAFDDIHPDAPEHLLIIPKKHLADLNATTDQDKELMGEIVLAAVKLAKERGIDQSGYRLIVNTNEHGGQVIRHIHFHLLGGRPLGHLVEKPLSERK